MKIAKIGSPNTYTQVLRDLQRFGFIHYHPSFDPAKGSQVELIPFDNAMVKSEQLKPTNSHTERNISDNEDEHFSTPEPHHVNIYFQEKGYDQKEAERFFNYHQSNGWLVGGRSKMKDWKAAARNWILNIPNFQTSSKLKNKNSPDINFSGQKYDEQLKTQKPCSIESTKTKSFTISKRVKSI
ncbi:MAG: hypothetical protein JW717_10750 [Marinilabiliaceae bacterium]|nr:hypothetical protein [Marinilabiliaceae bacterium]